MAFGLEFGSVFAASQDVCVCKRGLVLSAYEGWGVFYFASVDVYSPSHL